MLTFKLNEFYLAELAKYVWKQNNQDGMPRVVQAIKELRAVTGLGLKEAKDLIEANRAPPVDPVLAAAQKIIEDANSQCYTGYDEN